MEPGRTLFLYSVRGSEPLEIDIEGMTPGSGEFSRSHRSQASNDGLDVDGERFIQRPELMISVLGPERQWSDAQWLRRTTITDYGNTQIVAFLYTIKGAQLDSRTISTCNLSVILEVVHTVGWIML